MAELRTSVARLLARAPVVTRLVSTGAEVQAGAPIFTAGALDTARADAPALSLTAARQCVSGSSRVHLGRRAHTFCFRLRQPGPPSSTLGCAHHFDGAGVVRVGS